MHIRFDDELENLYLGLVDMANITEKSVTLLCNALYGKERNVREQVEAYAEAIKGRNHQLEASCMHLLLRRQPVAKDLRRISTVMKIISDLERIGDNSADVAEVLTYCPNVEECHLVQLDDMCSVVRQMLSAAVSSFISNNSAKAHTIVQSDDEVDHYFRKVKSLLTAIIREGRPGAETAPDLLMIAKYLERMGDHAASIASWVVGENERIES